MQASKKLNECPKCRGKLMAKSTVKHEHRTARQYVCSQCGHEQHTIEIRATTLKRLWDKVNPKHYFLPI